MEAGRLTFSNQVTGRLILLTIACFPPLQIVQPGKFYPANQDKRSVEVAYAPLVNQSSVPIEYNIGTGIAKVTDPAVGLGMQGMSDDKQKTTGVESELYSRAFIIEHISSGKRIVVLNADIWSCTHAIKKEVVNQLQASYGNLYSMDNVLISGTHNHSGPGGYSHNYLYNHSIRGFDRHNFLCIISGMVLSIKRAHNNLGPGRIYMNKGEIADCGRNRSPAAYNNNPPDERSKYANNTDKEMLLLKFVRITNDVEKPVGVLSWYGIHPTDRGQKNTKVTGDNKGYASLIFEKEMGTNYAAQETFVAAFANASAGDVSGNVEYGRIPNGKDDAAHMQAHGKKQYDKAKELFNSANVELKGEVDYRHRFVDMVAKAGAPGTLGLSMFAGSREDSNPGSGLKEGITEKNITASERALQASIASLFSSVSGVRCPTAIDLTKAQVDAHMPKPITLAPGVTNPLAGFPGFIPLTPTILPIQLFRIGQVAITGIPAEFTTMSGRRLKTTILNELNDVGVNEVALTTYANDYSQYVTTEEEYDMQHYEGGSTLFGPNTLKTYLAEYKMLANAIKSGVAVSAGPTPPDLTGKVRRIPRITIRNSSATSHTLYFYNHDDGIMLVEFSKKVIPPKTDMYFDITRPNGELIASTRKKAKFVLDKNKSFAPLISDGGLILITTKNTLRVIAYVPPPR